MLLAISPHLPGTTPLKDGPAVADLHTVADLLYGAKLRAIPLGAGDRTEIPGGAPQLLVNNLVAA